MAIQKVSIISMPGSGKSTLAKHLAKNTKIPVYHLDNYCWKANWERVDLQTYTQKHKQLCLQNNWIIEGMNVSIVDIRLQHSDIIIWLDIPRRVCIYNIFKRLWKYYGTNVPDMPKGCKQKLTKQFIQFILWVYKNHTPTRLLLKKKLASYSHKKIYILDSYKNVRKFLHTMNI